MWIVVDPILLKGDSACPAACRHVRLAEAFAEAARVRSEEMVFFEALPAGAGETGGISFKPWEMCLNK